MRGVYPGSFNPPTLAHVAITETAIARYDLTSLDLTISTQPLGKAAVSQPTLLHRKKVIEESISHIDRASVVISDLQLIADLAENYDLVVMGADKWQQVNEISFYDSPTERDESVARLPQLAIVARGGAPIPLNNELVLEADYNHVSASAAIRDARQFMTPAARAFDRQTGAWSDARRYEEYLAAQDQV